MLCDHNKIQIIHEERGWVWSCALCGDEMSVWNERVWDAIVGEQLDIGEGFVFNIVERGERDRDKLAAEAG